ncbi:MAG: MYXO-CTERM sorting domain-containing protein, partial [Myxococcota bacterium]
VSFGSLISFEPVTQVRDITVTNRGEEDADYDVSVAPTYALDGVDMSVSPASLTVAAGQSETVQLTLELRPSELPVAAPDPHTPLELSLGGEDPYPRHFVTEAGGHVVLTPSSGAAETLRVPYHGIVRAADRRAAKLSRTCVTDDAQTIQIAIEGDTTHREPVTSAFELAATNPSNPLASPEERVADLLALGVATNTATAESFGDASVYFGLAVAGEWMTPARGPVSMVGVDLDTNEDDSPDYSVYAEPLTREFFADVLAVTTYDLRTGQPVSRRFLNLRPRDELNTEPFNNSVVMLPVSLGELDITESDPSFRFRGFTQMRPFFRADATDWVTYDPTQPAVDTAVGGEDGVPYYPAPSPVTVQVPPDGGSDPAPSILLLHHSNERGMRHEVVQLSDLEFAERTDLVIEQQMPSEAGGSATVTWTITNVGDHMAYDVSVEGSFSGALGWTAEPSQGSCDVDESVRCSLGDLEAGAQVTVEADVIGENTTVEVTARVQDGISCETDDTNNDVSGTIVMRGSDTPPEDPDAPDFEPALSVDAFEPGGGCSCAVPSSSRERSAGGLAALAALGALVYRIRRKGV